MEPYKRYPATLSTNSMGTPRTLKIPLSSEGLPHRYLAIRVGMSDHARIWARTRTNTDHSVEYGLIGETTATQPNAATEELRQAARDAFVIDDTPSI